VTVQRCKPILQRIDFICAPIPQGRFLLTWSVPYKDPEMKRKADAARRPTNAYREQQARWRAENPNYHSEWRRQHPAYHRDYNRDLKLEVLNAYGGAICVECGETDLAALSLDHVDRDGAAHRIRLFGNRRAGGGAFYVRLRKLHYPQIPRLRVLCLSCNLRLWRISE